ncbi:hypothetical protein ACMD2_22019 [Ananas comosus]|uniref:Nodulin-like domain-containing protein n=1 Tax=Ananas comosus TaxID=4615 RepID=A0A199VHI6_ANACO|nr:hypothetical protein ACMD2_22019 [Ananas comosus]
MRLVCWPSSVPGGKAMRGLLGSRWLVFVAAMWMQSWAGVGYLFGSLSPAIKSSLGYNQRQIASLGVAKDLGDCVGFFAATLCDLLPLWAALLVGASEPLGTAGSGSSSSAAPPSSPSGRSVTHSSYSQNSNY